MPLFLELGAYAQPQVVRLLATTCGRR